MLTPHMSQYIIHSSIPLSRVFRKSLFGKFRGLRTIESICIARNFKNCDLFRESHRNLLRESRTRGSSQPRTFMNDDFFCEFLRNNTRNCELSGFPRIIESSNITPICELTKISEKTTRITKQRDSRIKEDKTQRDSTVLIIYSQLGGIEMLSSGVFRQLPGGSSYLRVYSRIFCSVAARRRTRSNC